MKLEILVENILLKTMIKSARAEYKPIIDLQEGALIRRFGSTKQTAIKALDDSTKASLMFAGAYQAIKSKLNTENKIFSELTEEDFKKIYSVYAASEAVIQSFSNNNSGSMNRTFNYKRPVLDFHLELAFRDYNTISDVLENLTKYISSSSSAEKVNEDITNFFIFLSGYALEKINSSYTSDQREVLENLIIKGKSFEVSGLKSLKKTKKGKSQTAHSENSDDIFEKDPTIITISKKISKEDIAGNEDAIDAIQSAVHQVMAWDPVAKMNPYLIDGSQRQTILLVGDSGTGKTLGFKYAMSEASRIAEANRIEFSGRSLDFDDSYQDGPVKILRYQLNSIANDNQVTLVFIDEMEAKFPARKSQKTGRHDEKVIRELLDFLNGLGYQNSGNYAVFGASNLPENIDKAIRSRFAKGTYFCEGPKTPAERAKVLYNNLLPGINKGYVKIANWKEIGEVATSLKLTGRDLSQCAVELIEKSRTNHYPDNFYKLNFQDKLNIVQSSHKTVEDEKLVNQLYKLAEKRNLVKQAARQFRED